MAASRADLASAVAADWGAYASLAHDGGDGGMHIPMGGGDGGKDIPVGGGDGGMHTPTGDASRDVMAAAHRDMHSPISAAARSVVARNGFRWGGGGGGMHAPMGCGDEWALLPRTSMLNHACAPNACVIMAPAAGACGGDGGMYIPMAVVLAVRAIAAGEEVQLCYESSLLVRRA